MCFDTYVWTVAVFFAPAPTAWHPPARDNPFLFPAYELPAQSSFLPFPLKLLYSEFAWSIRFAVFSSSRRSAAFYSSITLPASVYAIVNPLTPCSTRSQEFETILDGLSDALSFSRTIGASAATPYERGGGRNTTGEVDFYIR